MNHDSINRTDVVGILSWALLLALSPMLSVPVPVLRSPVLRSPVLGSESAVCWKTVIWLLLLA